MKKDRVDLIPVGRSNPYRDWFNSGKLIGVSADGLNVEDFQKGLKEVSVSVKESGAGKTAVNVTWVHPGSGIEARVNYSIFKDTDVVEWDGMFYNRGRKVIRNFRPFSLFLGGTVCGAGIPHVTTVYGGASTSGAYPPPSYRVFEQDGGVELICGREGGFSTETFIPTFIANDPALNKGFFLAYEWPCRSIIQMASGAVSGQKRAMSIWAHPGWVMFDLKPGESVCIPRIDVGFFNGDGIDGSNGLRRHIARHVIRPVKEGSPIPPVFYNHYFGWGNDWTERDMRREADVYSELGIEYFVVDAGWFKGNFRKGIGNWDIVDRKKFPSGMEAFSRYVEQKGMKFGTWLEIEFAQGDSDWVKRHPDWYYEAGELQNTVAYSRQFTDRLLKLDCRHVRERVADWLESWVNRYNIRWLRWDFNNTPLPFWMANEKDEMGRIHMKYGEGLLALLDEFMTRCPQVHIEACAGGGHRTDLGTLRRAHSLWMSDNSHTYDVMRRFQAGLNRMQTGNYGNSCFLWVTHERQRLQSIASVRKDGYLPAILRSRMAGSLGFAEQTWFWTPSIKRYLRKEIEKYKSIRHLIMKDYYPLFSPKDMRDYDGWQFHDPDAGEGFFMVFRCGSPSDRTEVFPGGWRSGERYELTDMDTGEKVKTAAGRELAFDVRKENGMRWFRYRLL